MRYAESIGFSSNVAQRIARMRPDLLRENMRLDPVEDAALRRAVVLYRGLGDVTLSELDFSFEKGSCCESTGEWAKYFAFQHAQRRPAEGQICRGFLIRFEVPGHKVKALYDEIRAKAWLSGQGVLANFDPEDMPDWTPFIANFGFAGPDGVIHTYPFEALFELDGQLTALAKRLDAQMPEAIRPRTRSGVAT